jgi:hypothetical protein
MVQQRRFRTAARILLLALLAPSTGARAVDKTKLAASPRPRLQAQAFPADVKARGDQLWATASPAVRTWVTQNATPLAKGTGDPDATARAAVHSRWGAAIPPSAVESLAFLVIYEAAKTVQADVQSNLDSMSEKSEIASPRVKSGADRLSKLISALSNLLRDMSLEQDILQNLK